MKKLPEAELEVMMQIWKAKEPVCRFDLEEVLAENGWAPTTILTLLSRLESKGFIRSEKQGKVKYYVPLVSESEYASKESRGVLERFFGNSLKKFVVSMAKQENFSEDELEELRVFLEEQKEKHAEESEGNDQCKA